MPDLDELKDKLLEAIQNYVTASGASWQDKKAALVATEDIDLSEMLGWWDVDLGEGS